jgi:hypothetical protein
MKRLLIGVFEREQDMMAAVIDSRARGLKVVDVYAPYAVHGLDKALGLPPSRIPWVCFALGLTGAALKVWFEIWTTAIDWPINVGGKPWNSLPAFVPVTFEVMVLFAGMSAVLAFLLIARLRPGKAAAVPVEGVTDNRFAVVLEKTDAAFDAHQVRQIFMQHHALDVLERAEAEPEVR